MKIYISAFAIILFYQACAQDKSKYVTNDSVKITQNVNPIKNVNMEEILRQQLRAGFSIDHESSSPKHVYGASDMDACVQIIKKMLLDSGVIINQQKSIERLKKIFGIENVLIPYRYISFGDKCKHGRIDQIMLRKQNDEWRSDYFYSKEAGLILQVYAIPELIDYKKKYPEIAAIEDANTIAYADRNGHVNTPEGIPYKIKRWKDAETQYELPKERIENARRIVAENAYLFNNDQSRLPWLFVNDKYFLHCLVKTFGYTDDKKLLKFVFDNTKPYSFWDKDSNLDDFGRLLWHKDCNGHAYLNFNTLNLIKEITSPESPEYLAHLSDYMVDWASDKKMMPSLFNKRQNYWPN